jgi:hypothetical protein
LQFEEIAMKMATGSAAVPTIQDVVSEALSRSCMTIEQLAAELGGSTSALVLKMMLAGSMKFTTQLIEPLAQALSLDPVRLTRLMLANYSPELLGLLDRLAVKGAPDLLTMNERRLIEHVREFTAGTDAEPVVNDGSTVVALIML